MRVQLSHCHSKWGEAEILCKHQCVLPYFRTTLVRASTIGPLEIAYSDSPLAIICQRPCLNRFNKIYYTDPSAGLGDSWLRLLDICVQNLCCLLEASFWTRSTILTRRSGRTLNGQIFTISHSLKIVFQSSSHPVVSFC